jgi:cytochrome c nitrite reductase small subunit
VTSSLKLATVAAILIGSAVGLAGYTFLDAKGYSYLTNNPAACANCHVMQDYYDAWIKSSHRAAAVCNDCHTPHNLAGKYATKALNGFFHSLAFTTQRFPDAILITPRNYRVTEGACRSCHAEITSAIVGPHTTAELSCTRCHFNVGHSAASYVIGAESSVSLQSEENSHVKP